MISLLIGVGMLKYPILQGRNNQWYKMVSLRAQYITRGAVAPKVEH